MSYTPIEAREGVQPIALAANSQNHPPGTIVRAFDPSYGEGEFIYLLGVGGTVTGSVVTWGGVAGSGATAKPTWQTGSRPPPPTLASRSPLQWRQRGQASSAGTRSLGQRLLPRTRRSLRRAKRIWQAVANSPPLRPTDARWSGRSR